MLRNKKYFTNLQGACDSGAPNKLFAVAISHRMPDPISDMISHIVEIDLSSYPAKYNILLTANDSMFPKYYSGFNCIARDPSGSLFVGEDDGIIICKDGKAALVNFGVHAGITNCCYVRGIDNVVFGTARGEVVHFDRNQLQAVRLGSQKNVELDECKVSAIHGVGADFMVAVGENGLISCYRNGVWTSVKPPSNAYMRSVWCRSEAEIYVGAKRGLAWRWDGKDKWEKLKIDSNQSSINFTLASIAEYQGEIYAACVEHGIYCLRNNTWIAIPKVKDEDVRFITASSSGLIGLGALWGDSGSWLTRYDGKSWTAQKIQVNSA